jgi:short chain dehydrogenase
MPDCLPACLPLCLPACMSACVPLILSSCLPACLPAYLSVCQRVCLSMCVSPCLLACLPADLSVCVPAFVSTCVRSCLPACMSIRPSACFSPCLLACLPVRLNTPYAPSGSNSQPSSLKGQGGAVISPSGAYSCSKAAVKAYADALRLETLGTGVTIHVALPGCVNTPLLRDDIINYAEVLPPHIPLFALGEGVSSTRLVFAQSLIPKRRLHSTSYWPRKCGVPS